MRDDAAPRPVADPMALDLPWPVAASDAEERMTAVQWDAEDDDKLGPLPPAQRAPVYRMGDRPVYIVGGARPEGAVRVDVSSAPA